MSLAFRCFALTFALLVGAALSSSSEIRESFKASKAQFRSLMRASAQAHMTIEVNLQAMSMKAKKYGIKLPWAGSDADGGEEYEFGNQIDHESDPKLFTMDEYKHPSEKDDADVAEDEPYSEDELNHGDNEIAEHEDDSSQSD